jgi:hypothetical protein
MKGRGRPAKKPQVITPEQWVALSRKFARSARSGFSAQQRTAIAGFIEFVAHDTKTRKILGNNRHKSRQDHPTPWSFISAVESRFDLIAIDLAATARNAKAGEFITPRQNSLKCDWDEMLKGRVYSAVSQAAPEPGPCGRLHEWDWMKDIGDGRYTKGE